MEKNFFAKAKAIEIDYVISIRLFINYIKIILKDKIIYLY